jgi:hypothetical protein
MCANAGRGEGPVAAPVLTRLEQEVRVCRADLTKANPFTSESSWRWASGIGSRWSNDWARLVHRITGAVAPDCPYVFEVVRCGSGRPSSSSWVHGR